MSIFRREPASSSPSPAIGPSDAPAGSSRRRVTHIAPGTRMRGEVTGPTELLIEGELEGEVRVESMVVVGVEGTVQGPVTAQVVRVGGKIVGNVHASERIEIAPAGSVEGDLAAPRVVIAEGAFFKGRVEMKGNQDQEARRSKASGQPRNQ